MLRFATRLSILLVLLACTVCGAIGHYRYSGPPYDAIDRHALAASAEVGRDLDSLAAYLAAGARTDREKARAIYIWIIDRITYDEAALKDGSGTAEYALRSRRVVCRGYANLFRALAGRMGLESTVVRGWAKSGLDLERHAWNAVCIDGNWQLVDSTWGDCDGERTASREAIDYCANFYFLTPPERLISSHFPYDSRWQCLAEPIKLDQFTAQPECDLAFYRAGLKLVSAPERFEGPFQLVLEGPGDLVVDAKLGDERDDHSTMVTRRGNRYFVDVWPTRVGQQLLRVYAGSGDEMMTPVALRVIVDSPSSFERLPTIYELFVRQGADLVAPRGGRLPANEPVRFEIYIPRARAAVVQCGRSKLILRPTQDHRFVGDCRLRGKHATIFALLDGGKIPEALVSFEVE